MRPDLPWNVAGIPSEAREAARAAARREGLSVGEWLTRRITRELAGESETYQPMRETYSPAAPAYRAPEEPAPRLDTSDMLTRLSRTDSEAQDIYRRIESQLGGLGRRMETTERNTAENNRAMSKAATEINIAAREQAQAFDQLSAHVVSLSNRLDRLEGVAGGNDSMKEAVKTLHQGLTRLAEQIGHTAKQSATQIEALANNLESVVAKIAEVRSTADGAARTTEQRMAMLDDRVHVVESAMSKIADARTNAEGAVRMTEQRMAMLDERVRVIERVSHSSADALDKALENMEVRQQQSMQDTADIHRRVGGVEHLNDAIDRLTSRFASSEAQTATAIARMEDNILRLDGRGSDPAIDRRLNSIERTLGDIVARFESAPNVDDSIRRLSQRIDSFEQRHEDTIENLHATLASKAGTQPASTPAPAPVMQPPPVPSAYVEPVQAPASSYAANPAPLFDAPPFPESAPPKADPFADAFAPVFNPTAGEPPANPFADFAPQPAFDTPAPAAVPPPPAANESFLAAARRSAQAAAAAADNERSKSFAFNWSSAAAPAAAGAGVAVPSHTPVVEPADRDEKKPSRMRYLIMGGAALILILAALSVILSQRAGVDQAGRHNGLGALLVPDKAPATQTQSVPVQPAVTAAPATAPAQPAAGAKALDTADTAKAPVAGTTPQTAPAATAPKQASVTALDKLTAMANSGNARAELIVALKYLDGDGVPANDAQGAKWLEKAANQNEPVAQYRLGTLYERGKGVTADAAKAVKWYTAAAQAGNRKAMHNLAVAYAQGSGVAKNFTEAARWFSRASALGLSDSQFNLAVLYERGLGVPQSLVDAYKWYAIAAAQGDTESKNRIDALATQISADDRAAAQRAAELFKPQAMDRRANATPDIAEVTRG